LLLVGMPRSRFFLSSRAYSLPGSGVARAKINGHVEEEPHVEEPQIIESSRVYTPQRSWLIKSNSAIWLLDETQVATKSYRLPTSPPVKCFPFLARPRRAPCGSEVYRVPTGSARVEPGYKQQAQVA
jgi:hypothetical protein